MNAKILVVDDDEITLTSIAEILLTEGYFVVEASNGADALNILEQDDIDLMLLDIMMPGMSGIELLQQIKKVNPLCTVVMMTGYSSMSNVVDCLGNGAADYFVKPFRDIDSLVEAVNHAIARIARWREAMPLGHAEVR